jgi:hypothetical protein
MQTQARTPTANNTPSFLLPKETHSYGIDDIHITHLTRVL